MSKPKALDLLMTSHMGNAQSRSPFHWASSYWGWYIIVLGSSFFSPLPPYTAFPPLPSLSDLPPGVGGLVGGGVEGWIMGRAPVPPEWARPLCEFGHLKVPLSSAS